MRDNTASLFTRRTTALTIALLFFGGGLLLFEGRPWWCKYGFGILTGARTHCTSQHLLDPYTLTHVLHGVMFFWFLRPFAARLALSQRLVIAVGLEIAWEILENSNWVIERYRQDTASLDYTGDSVVNAIADILATVAGFAFASRFSWKASVGMFILFELGMLYFARDNLTLNVLMLFYPVEAIKQWQLGA